MKERTMTWHGLFKRCTLPALAAWSAGASAHDGHGMTGSHWHASDAWGIIALAVAVALAAWLSGGKD
ncbi:MAG: hypothetical protein LH632_16420 [Rhodoferax sp.]|nr:hypothetical protein [Rhodoferax sp.]